MKTHLITIGIILAFIFIPYLFGYTTYIIANDIEENHLLTWLLGIGELLIIFFIVVFYLIIHEKVKNIIE